MSDSDVPTHARCVVYDVQNSYNNRERRRYDNNTKKHKQRNVVHQPGAPCAQELERAINTITEYGQQAYAMGAIRALNLLTNMAVRLRAIASAPRSDELCALAEEAEIAMEEIRSSLGRSRNQT